jgi:hypothetical protein
VNQVLFLPKLASYSPAARSVTSETLARNLTIAERLGCLTPAGMADMRRGQSPTVAKGPYTGDQLSVDHIIPKAVVPELDKVLANLELMPLRMNLSKGASMGQRQEAHARALHAVGLLSAEGLKRVTGGPPVVTSLQTP